MPDKKTPAETFRAMADRLDKNAEEFAGCFLVVSPKGAVASQLFVNPVGDEMAFWGFVSKTLEIAGTEAMQKETGPMGMQGRMR